MDEYISKQNAYTNVTQWHEAGITGKGITVWNLEGLGVHGKGTRARVLDAAPDAKVLNKPWNMECSSTELRSSYVYDDETKENLSFDGFMEKYRPQILTSSRTSSKARTIWTKKALTHARNQFSFIAFNAAGNDGTAGIKPNLLPVDEAMYIGAAMMYRNDPKDIRIATYSSLGFEFEDVDFSTFTGPGGTVGTSFAAPFIAGQTALLLQRYGKMSQEEVYNYLKMISVPLDTDDPHDVQFDFSGGYYLYDHWSGYGIPVLPDISKRYLTFRIGEGFYGRDGKTVEMDTAPFIKDSRTFVPISFIALGLGAKVAWHSLTRKVEIVKDDICLILKIGSKTYEVNGVKKEMDTAPFIKDDRTFVPVSFVALELGCRVSWEPVQKMVQILEV